MAEEETINIKQLRELYLAAEGGDSEAQTLLKELLKIDYVQEKTNLPTVVNQQKQTYLKMCETFFGQDPHYGDQLKEPFKTHSDWDALTWRSYKGFVTEKQTEMLKKGTDLSGLILQQPGGQLQAEQQKLHWWSKKKSEGEQLSE